MLDLKEFRKNPKKFEEKLKTKDPDVDFSTIVKLDEDYRKTLTAMEELQSKRNTLSKEIGLKKSKKEEAPKEMEEVKSINNDLDKYKRQIASIEEEKNNAFAVLPNLPMDDIPISMDPKDNVCIKTHGEKKTFSFPFKNHVELNEKLKLFDFETSAKISGAGWPLYINMGAKLEWALINYMLDIHQKNGFTFIMPPHLVQPKIMYGAGQLPKFKDQLFKINDEDYQLYLIPTAEVALNGMHYDQILDEKDLPRRYVSYTPCFRREAGAAGKQERGLIRMHQFNKVELFCFARPEESSEIFDKMIASAEEVLQGLQLHYRNMLLVTGDMSFASAKTVDIEVWLPGQDRYYEVSSVSNCTDFQSRRSKIRYKTKEQKTQLVHTLNGSGVATSRLMVALLENNQLEDGSVKIPTVLQKYMEKEVSLLRPQG